jgi:hypothetical protein
MPSSIHGTIFLSTSLLTCVTVHVPRAGKHKGHQHGEAHLRQATRPAFAYFRTAMSVPQVDCILFVPSAICGGRPAHSNAGKEINPPPPAMASMNPALSPAKKQEGDGFPGHE